MKVETVPTVELSDNLYQNFASREFPMCDLLNTYGPVFRFTAPGYELHDAKNIEHLLDELASINPMAVANKGPIIRKFSYQILKTEDNAKVYRNSSPKPKKNTINLKSYLTTGKKLNAHELDSSSIADIDKLCNLVAKKSVNYIHNIGYQLNYLRDVNVFHNPAMIRSPLALLKRKDRNQVPGISDDWLFIGKRYTNSFFHTDDFGLPVANTMLNNGSKLWMVVDPSDNHKLIEKLRSISKLDNSCPYNYLDTMVLIPASTLQQWNIKFFTCIQRQHETVVLGDNIFHQCINLDLSVNSGANFLSSLKFTEDTIYCQCPKQAKRRHDDAVEINGPQLLASWRLQNVQYTIHQIEHTA